MCINARKASQRYDSFAERNDTRYDTGVTASQKMQATYPLVDIFTRTHETEQTARTRVSWLANQRPYRIVIVIIGVAGDAAVVVILRYFQIVQELTALGRFTRGELLLKPFTGANIDCGCKSIATHLCHGYSVTRSACAYARTSERPLQSSAHPFRHRQDPKSRAQYHIVRSRSCVTLTSSKVSTL